MIRRICVSAIALAALFTAAPALAQNVHSATPNPLTNVYTGGLFSFGNGLALDSGDLYYGDLADLTVIDLGDLSTNVQAALPGSVAPAFINRDGGQTFVGFSTSFGTPPAPSNSSTGRIDAGTYVERSLLEGVYDGAFSPLTGSAYLSAAADEDNNNIVDPAGVFLIDYAAGTTTKIIDVGGSSGPIAFDAAGNMYYGFFDLVNFTDHAIYRFDAGDLPGGSLTLADATKVVDLPNGPGYIAIDKNGNLIVTEGQALVLYDPTTGDKVDRLAFSGGLTFFGALAYDAANDTVYSVVSDFGDTFTSSVVGFSTVPEPASAALLLVGAAAVAQRRRKDSTQ